MTLRGRLFTAVVLASLSALALLLGVLSVRFADAQAGAVCKGKRATIVGTARQDELRGTPSRDVFQAKGGSDDIEALAGHDLICAGAGNDDDVDGNRGNDTIYTQSGNDEGIDGDRGNDTIRGGRGFDEGDGGPGTDVCKSLEDLEECESS